jgi:hypothetical protein
MFSPSTNGVQSVKNYPIARISDVELWGVGLLMVQIGTGQKEALNFRPGGSEQSKATTAFLPQILFSCIPCQ